MRSVRTRTPVTGGNVVEAADVPNAKRVRAGTVVFCPQCGKRTGLTLGSGDAVEYCFTCKIDIEVSIHVIEKREQEQA